MAAMPAEEDEINEDDLDTKVRSLMSKHKQMKRREQVDKELSRSNTLLSKYDTTRVLALRARSKLTAQREMNKQINIAVTDNEDGDETEFLRRVANVDFSENVIASPQRGSLRPKSAPSHRKKDKVHKTTPFLNRYDSGDPREGGACHTPSSDKKKKKKQQQQIEEDAYQSGLDFTAPPQLPPPIDHAGDGDQSPTLGARQKPKPHSTHHTTFNPDEWWSEQQRLNPDAPYKVPIRRSHSEPVLKRPKSAGRARSGGGGGGGGEGAMSTKDLKSFLTESRHSKTRPPSSRMYLAEYKKAQDQKKETIMAAILEEASNRETKVNVCLEEANAYAKSLGLTRRFSLYWRSPDIAQQNASMKKFDAKPMNTYEMAMAAQKTDSHHAFNTLQGAGARIEKMLVEVMEARGEATRLISVDAFFKDHEHLQLEVRRKRNLMSTEHRAQEEREEKIKAKEVGAKRKGVVDKQESFLQHLENMKVKEDASSSAKSSSKVRRKQTEERVNRILQSTAGVTRVLEDQLRELQARGWNEGTGR